MKATEVTNRCLVDRAPHTPHGACSMDAQSKALAGYHFARMTVRPSRPRHRRYFVRGERTLRGGIFAMPRHLARLKLAQ
jgi:hypothetical protein